ncbi:MAG TPA: ribonuclease P protein component [Chthonomonadales bacterium]|nr:ribonuclease P protein component [Chthonomonadales bacterium]
MPKANRLCRSRDFRRVRQVGATVREPLVVLTAAPGLAAATRIGFVVSRKLGGAVARNRVRRRLRVACASRLAAISPARDVVVVARSAARDVSYQVIDAAVGAALAKAGVLAGPSPQADGTCETRSSS